MLLLSFLTLQQENGLADEIRQLRALIEKQSAGIESLSAALHQKEKESSAAAPRPPHLPVGLDIPQWLVSVGLQQYQQLFAAHKLTVTDLADLCHADLVSIGIHQLHARKAILRAVNRLLFE
jgi:hypothetical protein